MIRYSYLPEQFADADDIWTKIRKTVERGDYTLGAEVAAFEADFSAYCGTSHAIGVNSGTDALFLSLKALGIGGEVITTPYTFFATSAAIVHARGRPVYADVGLDFNIDPAAIEAAITPSTEAIVPVHWAGRPCNMTAINIIAERHGLAVIEDAAHAAGAMWKGKHCGRWGRAGAFSLHPLKTLNVWGDGGVVVTNDDALAGKIRRMRNHGLVDRDHCNAWGYNSRLDSVQAVVARHVLAKLNAIRALRRHIAAQLDLELRGVEGVSWEPMHRDAFSTYYLYTLRAERRDMLLARLLECGVDAKIHYPVPLHLQAAAKSLGYKRGDFPVAERLADETISLPAHEFVTDAQIGEMGAVIREFYESVQPSRRAA